jgi:hypothetical protein
MFDKLSSHLVNFIYLILFIVPVGCGSFISTRVSPTGPLTFTNVVALNTSNLPNFPISGTCTNESGDVEIRFGNPVIFSLTLPCTNKTFSGSVDLSSVGIPEGSNVLVAVQSATDLQATANLLVDTTPPVAPGFSSPTNGSTIVSALQTVTGSCENGSVLSLTGDVASALTDITCSAGIYFQAILLTAGNGPKVISLSQIDAAGNTSPNGTLTLNLDTTVLALPVAPFISSPVSGALTNQISQVLQGTCETGAQVNISGSFNTSPILVTCANGNFSRSVSLVSGDGVKNINVTQTNATGSSPQTSLTLTLDATIPLAPTITSPINNATTNQVSQKYHRNL